MAKLNRIPTTGVNLIDIRDTLNGNGGSVGNELLQFFKTSAKNNKWSKWKPIIVSSDFVDNESTFKTYNWGISIPSTYDLYEAFNGVGESSWGYGLPSGGTSSPYRLGDYRSYRPNSTSPFRELEVSHVSAIAGDSVTVTLYCRMFNTTNEDGMLGLNDMGTLNGCQCCFIKMSPSGSLSHVISNDSIASNHGSISAIFPAFSTSQSELGTHTFAAALYKNGVYYPLPITKKTVLVETSKLYDSASLSGDCYSDVLTASLYYLRGTTNASAITITPTFYFGNSSSQWIMVGGNTIIVNPGNTGISKVTIDKYQNNSSYWSEIYSLAQADNLYIRCSAGGGTVKVSVIL